jgi:transcriptional regulator GlxA family with amidase domain
LIVRQDATIQVLGPIVQGAETRLLRGSFRNQAGSISPLWNGVAPLLRINGEDGRFKPWVAGLLNVIQAELISGQERMACVVNQLVTVLLIKALREADASESHSSSRMTLADVEINQVLTMIHERPEVAWTVARLADSVDLSRSSFAARFVDALGRPPMEYLREFRLAEAQRLLREGERGMKEIAARAGYRTASAFSIAFKREFGMTPGEYRASAR